MQICNCAKLMIFLMIKLIGTESHAIPSYNLFKLKYKYSPHQLLNELVMLPGKMN